MCARNVSRVPVGGCAGHNGCMAEASSYLTRPLRPDTWDDFARLVDANNGVWGGCWCMGFDPEGVGKGHTLLETVWQNRPTFATEQSTRSSSTTATNASAGASSARQRSFRTSTTRKPMPGTWARCATGESVASSRDAVTGAMGCGGRPRPPLLAAIHDAGGGLVEAYPEQVEERPPQRGAYFHTGPTALFEEFGFERNRKIAKWRWVMRLRIPS